MLALITMRVQPTFNECAVRIAVSVGVALDTFRSQATYEVIASGAK